MLRSLRRPWSATTHMREWRRSSTRSRSALLAVTFSTSSVRLWSTPVLNGIRRSGRMFLRDGPASQWRSRTGSGQALQPQIRAVLQEHLDDPQVKFAWLRLRDHLPWTRVVLSSESLEITPRFFLSWRTSHRSWAPSIDCSCRQLSPTTPFSSGHWVARHRRLASRSSRAPTPRRANASYLQHLSSTGPLDRAWVIEWAAKIATRHSVVALCPSRKLARAWQDAGAELGVGDNVESVVERLRSGALRFAVLAQRYDGSRSGRRRLPRVDPRWDAIRRDLD
jgi:hypothetical protein